MSGIESSLKDDIVHSARQFIKENYPTLKPSAACLYSAFAILKEIHSRQLKVRAMPNAGSMHWPCIDLTKDDGIGNTHFAYVWSPSSIQSQISIAFGNLPEMHVWVVLPETNELIDICTGAFPSAYHEITDNTWSGPLPPDYIWGRFEDLPNGVYYEAIREASELSFKLILELTRMD